MRITDYLTPAQIRSEMRATDKQTAIAELAGLLTGDRHEGLEAEVLEVLLEREGLASTGIGNNVAIPHGKLDAVGALMIGIGRSGAGIEFESVDGLPTQLFFVLVAPSNATAMHLKALARISRLCREAEVREELIEAADGEAMFAILEREDRKYG